MNPPDSFFEATRHFAKDFTSKSHNDLRGIDNGKAVGTYVEQSYRDFLLETKTIEPNDVGNSAKGIDLPGLNMDVKVTSIKQPQSSSPFKSFKQKIEGLGYNLMLFVYEKTDTATDCFIKLLAVRYIPAERTADWQTTRGLLDVIGREANSDDIFAFLKERMIPVDDETLMAYAESLLANPPQTGYLTISNALQWRLHYKRVITSTLQGIVDLDPIEVENLEELIPDEPFELVDDEE